MIVRFALAVVLLAVSGLASHAMAVPVTFRFVPADDMRVSTVSLRGAFNDWGETPMVRGDDGAWSVTAELAAGEHAYKFFIDGEWPGDMATWLAGGPVDAEADGYVDDGFGGQNALRIVRAGDATSKPETAGVSGAADVAARAAPGGAGLPEGLVRIHYHRPDGDYTGWGLHVWEDAAESVTWTRPLESAGIDDFGQYWDVKLKPGAKRVGFIVHRGDTKDPGPDMFLEIPGGPRRRLPHGPAVN